MKHDTCRILNTRRIQYLMATDNPRLATVLDECNGSKAVEYVLEELIADGNTHTIQSVLELIRRESK